MMLTFPRLVVPLPALAVLLVVAPLAAQPARSGPPPVEVTLGSVYSASASAEGSEADFGHAQVAAAVSLPLPPLGGLRSSVAFGVTETEFRLGRFDRILPGAVAPAGRARSWSFRPAFSYAAGERTRLLVSPRWETHAAAGAAQGDAVQTSLLAGAFHRYSDRLTVAAGLVAADRIGYAKMVFPFVGFDWRWTDEWSLAIKGDSGPSLRPGLALTRRLADNLALVAAVTVEDVVVRLAGNSSIPGGTMRRESLQATLALEWTPAPQWKLAVFGGEGFRQRYEFRDAHRREVAQADIGNSPVAGLSVKALF